MPEATLHPETTLARKAVKYWPLVLVLLVYAAIALMPLALGETSLAQNVRLVGDDRIWMLGILYGVVPSAGQSYSFRVILGNFGRLSFGVALVAAAVTVFPVLIPTFYLLYALSAAGMGASFGCVLGPRSLTRILRSFDARSELSPRFLRLGLTIAFVALFCAAVAAMAYQLFAHHDWVLLAYGACALWGAVIAKPAIGKKKAAAAA